ncbi:hypothetical protein C9374_002143 [Naegleria lovaniensis]|uniref:CID domain-containing protein n=1 Tax=Naegleria lovaniensis TaxID=51637 RepID=A0AA88GVJ4_NAELO|nr:uncharacterized protein C9374_002143 [Naegleria lovaniensis]KAG2387108.1 hypothetical protein C9374_002143 [Naegleria lovaniensis]
MTSTLPEVVQEFSTALQTDLQTNDRMQIDMLTEIANDNIEYCRDIAKVLCTRINIAPAPQKIISSIF